MKRLEKHLRNFSILYVLGIYTLPCTYDLLFRKAQMKDYYSVWMVIVGIVVLLTMEGVIFYNKRVNIK